MMAKRLRNVTDLVEALGGVSAVAEWLSCTRQAIYHWQSQNVVPAKHYSLLKAELLKRGYAEPPAELWSFSQ